MSQRLFDTLTPERRQHAAETLRRLLAEPVVVDVLDRLDAHAVNEIIESTPGPARDAAVGKVQGLRAIRSALTTLSKTGTPAR